MGTTPSQPGNTASYDLEIVGLRKAFGPNNVLRGLSLTIREGEFVGLMGPNGAGKSTLIKILAGVYDASGGSIRLGGKAVRSLAESPDVGIIHQDLGLVDGLTIAENLSLGVPAKRLFGPVLDKRAERDDARRALERVRLDLHVDSLVGDLTAGEKTLVAVARVFDRGARILLIDETTSTLAPADARRVITSLAGAAADGATVIMVSHKLSEILDATERILVLIDGELVRDVRTKGVDRAALVEMLKQQHEGTGPASTASESGLAGGDSSECLIELRDVWIGKLGPVNLRLNAGEVVGISGLVGSGLHDLAFVVNGNLEPDSGTVELARPDLERALVPPHRESQGGFAELTVRENVAVSALARWRRIGGLLDPGHEKDACGAILDELTVVPRSLDATYDVLSGGNKQKVIFARALLRRPDVYVLCEPTRGVDVKTRSEIYRLVRELASRGAAVLVASSDAEDLFSICDRAALIAGGRLQPVRPITELTASELEMMV